MLGKRVTAIVEWNLDQVPGWNDNPDDVIESLQRGLNEQIPHYNPIVYVQRTVVSPYQYKELRDAFCNVETIIGTSYDEALNIANEKLMKLGIVQAR